METIRDIEVSRLHPHPNNPRKNIGNIEELTESVRTNGIMQNLTVIPSDTEGGYTVLIGHRRLEAARAAGLDTVPCSIVEGLGMTEQIGIMLLENIQRNDLTIPEQAQGFQMMLDLGESVDTISERTGFSKSTVRHRLNIAKLDAEILDDALHTKDFQLSISDLVALEQVKSIDTRNKILKDAHSSANLISRAYNAAREEEREEKKKKIHNLLAIDGVEPSEEPIPTWNRDYETITELSLDADIPERIDIDGLEGGMIDGYQAYYTDRYNSIAVVKKIKAAGGAVETDDTESEARIAEKERKDRLLHIEDALVSMKTRQTDYIDGIIEGKIPMPADVSAEAIWKILARQDVDVDRDTLVEYCLRNDDEPTQEEYAEVEALPMPLQMLIILMDDTYRYIDGIANWCGRYIEHSGVKYQNLMEAFKHMGYDAPAEDIALIDGTSDLYLHDEEGGEAS